MRSSPTPSLSLPSKNVACFPFLTGETDRRAACRVAFAVGLRSSRWWTSSSSRLRDIVIELVEDLERIGENWRELELQAVTYSGAELNLTKTWRRMKTWKRIVMYSGAAGAELLEL